MAKELQYSLTKNHFAEVLMYFKNPFVAKLICAKDGNSYTAYSQFIINDKYALFCSRK